MLKKKFILKFVLIGMVLSLFTVGFATWYTIVPTLNTENNGNILVDDVYEFSDYADINFNRELIYNEHGFVSKNIYNTETSTFEKSIYDTIETTINVDIASCKETFDTAKTIKITVKLIDLSNYSDINTILNNVEIINESSDFILSSYGVEEAPYNNKYAVLSLNIEDYTESTSIINLSFKFNTTDSNFFSALSKINDDEAFMINASLALEY